VKFEYEVLGAKLRITTNVVMRKWRMLFKS